MRFIMIALIVLLTCGMAGCMTHRMYDTAQFRDTQVQYQNLTIHETGLTAEQIKAITSTKPPHTFPVDIAVIIIKSGYIETRHEDMFSYNIIQELKNSEMIDRVMLVPNFLIPAKISFNTIQELGIRSLSEYVVVFYLDASEFFRWTAIASNKFEINSSMSFILVDAGTSAILASDKLVSTVEYSDTMFKTGEQDKARKQIFSEQAKLLAEKLDALFNDQ